MIGDHLGDLRERPRLVDGLQLEPGREALRRLRIDVPAHVEPALGLVVEGGERRRLDRIDRHPFAWSQDADDAVARNGAAVGGKAHRQIRVEPADRDASLAPRALPRQPDLYPPALSPA